MPERGLDPCREVRSVLARRTALPFEVVEPAREPGSHQLPLGRMKGPSLVLRLLRNLAGLRLRALLLVPEDARQRNPGPRIRVTNAGAPFPVLVAKPPNLAPRLARRRVGHHLLRLGVPHRALVGFAPTHARISALLAAAVSFRPLLRRRTSDATYASQSLVSTTLLLPIRATGIPALMARRHARA